MTTAAVGAIAPVIKVGGRELRHDVLNSLVGMKVSGALRLPSRATLEFLDQGFALSAGATFELGSAVQISLPDNSSLFKGEITGVELDVERGAPILSVVADDAAYKMTLGNTVRTFTKMSYSQMVAKIAADHSLPLSSTTTKGQQEYVMQADTDFGFLTEIADRVGYDWWVDPRGKLQFHPMGSARSEVPRLGWNDDFDGMLRHFSVRASALHPQSVTANGWDSGSQQSVESSNSTVKYTPDASFVKPFLKPRKLSKSSNVSTAYRAFDKQGDGTAMATSIAAQSLAGAVVADGVCRVNARVAVGQRVTIKDTGPASGQYYVTEVEHVYGTNGFETRFTAGDRRPTGLVDSLTESATPSSFRQDALVVGLVTNLGNSESPKGYVKVRFPTLGKQVESAWARVVSSGAGKKRGMTFLPEVNDEVIIGFENGDVARPLVLGGLYSGKNDAANFGTKDGKIDKRQIVSRLGHYIELADGTETTDQHIWLMLQGDEFAIKLGKDGLVATVPSGQPITLTNNGATIELDKQGNISLSGNKISIKAKEDVDISGANVKAKADMAVQASGVEAKLEGSGTAELSSGGKTAVKGSMVMIN